MVTLHPIRVVLRNPNHLLVADVPHKVVVGARVVVEKVNVQTVLADPAASDVRIAKVLVNHGVVVDTANLVHFDLSFLDFFLGPRDSAEDPHTEQPIVEVAAGEELAVGVLLHLFDLDVLFWVSSDFFLKSQLLSLHGVHLDIGFTVITLSHSDSSC